MHKYMENTEFITVLNWFEREFINKNYLFLLLFHFKKMCYNFENYNITGGRMKKDLDFSSAEEIQKIALKSEKLREIMKMEMGNIDFGSIDSIQEYIDEYFSVFVHDGTLEFDEDFYMIEEGGVYFINGDFIINGKLDTYGATTLCVTGNLTADEVIFCDAEYIIEKDLIVKNKLYLCDTDLWLEVKGKVETPVIYSSIEEGRVKIGSISPDTKGIIIKSSYGITGKELFLKNLNLNEIIIEE